MSNITTVQTDSVIVSLMRASSALAEAKTIQHTKKIVDLAAAAEIYARRQQLGEEAEGFALSIKLEALRKLGEMLKLTPKNAGVIDRSKKGMTRGDKGVPRVDEPETLAELGIDKRTSAVAQKLAGLSDESFEQVRQGNETVSKALAKVKAAKDAESGSKPATVKDAAPADSDAHGEVNVLDQYEKEVKENARLGDLVESMSKDDKAAEIKKLNEEIYSLRGRVNQLMASEKAATDKLKYMTDLVHKLRKIFGVETHKEIIAAAQAMVA